MVKKKCRKPKRAEKMAKGGGVNGQKEVKKGKLDTGGNKK